MSDKHVRAEIHRVVATVPQAHRYEVVGELRLSLMGGDSDLQRLHEEFTERFYMVGHEESRVDREATILELQDRLKERDEQLREVRIVLDKIRGVLE